MTLRITGLVARPAVYTVAPGDGRVRLVVDVHMGDAHHAVARIVRCMGQGFAAQYAAATAARQLREGQRVQVHADGLDFLNGRLIVVGCSCIHADGEAATEAAA